MEEINNYKIVPRYVIKSNKKVDDMELWKKAYDNNGISEVEKETLLNSILDKRYFLIDKDNNFVKGRSFPTEEQAAEFIKENRLARLEMERDEHINNIYAFKEELSRIDRLYRTIKKTEPSDIKQKDFEEYKKRLYFLDISKVKEVFVASVLYKYKEKIAELKNEKSILKDLNKEIKELKTEWLKNKEK